jgi:hypothetical protein
LEGSDLYHKKKKKKDVFGWLHDFNPRQDLQNPVENAQHGHVIMHTHAFFFIKLF